MTTTERIRTRLICNQVRQIREHLEAMQRDVHGIEYSIWKQEVDALWKSIFHNIEKLSEDTQKSTLQLIREPWTMYLTYYVAPSM